VFQGSKMQRASAGKDPTKGNASFFDQSDAGSNIDDKEVAERVKKAEAKFGLFNYDNGPLQDFETNYLENKVPNAFELKKLVMKKKV